MQYQKYAYKDLCIQYHGMSNKIYGLALCLLVLEKLHINIKPTIYFTDMILDRLVDLQIYVLLL